MDALLEGLRHPLVGPLYALVAGVLASASPCALSALPLVFGHMAGSTRKSRVADLAWFIAGLTVALAAVGLLAGLLGRSLTLSTPWIRVIAGLAFIVGGAAYAGMLGGSRKCSVPLAGGMDGPVSRPLAGATMGALYGVSASPCSTPALLAILALVAATGSPMRGAALLFFYSAGQSLLVAVAGLATSAFRGFLESAGGLLALDVLRKAGGAAIAVFGVYMLVRPYL
jgi:cytochrome c biogenesis protein CcdA